MTIRVMFMTRNAKYLVKILKFMSFRGMACGSESKNIGFIGLGNMGGHMSTNLIKKGHKLHVYDISKAATDALKAKGATVYSSVGELASKSEFIVTMLPNNQIVYNTYTAILKAGINKKTICIDSSTIDPGVVKSIQKLVREKGARFVDAPVSGGIMGAEKGTLTFMVGGSKDEVAAIKPVLDGMGKRIEHCGGIGMGQSAKLCNAIILGVTMIGVSEAMNLAIRLGLDVKTFSDVVNHSTGRCWCTEIYNPVPGVIATAPSSHEYDGGFSSDLIAKDLDLASGIATASNSPIALGAMAHQFYRILKAKGLGCKDFSIVYDFLKNECYDPRPAEECSCDG